MASASEEEGDIDVDDGGDNSYLGGGFAEQGLPSHHFGPFSPANDSETEAASPVYAPTHYVDVGGGDDNSFVAHSVETPTGTPNYSGVAGAAGIVAGFSADPQVAFPPETGGESLATKEAPLNENFVTFSSATDGSILPPPADMEPEEGFQLCEWKRQNAMRLQEKEKREGELVIQIREEADEYKLDFHRRRQLNSETRKANNREKEKGQSSILCVGVCVTFPSCLWRIKRSSMPRLRRIIGRLSLNLFPKKCPILKREERKRTKNRRLPSFMDQSLESPQIFLECVTSF